MNATSFPRLRFAAALATLLFVGVRAQAPPAGGTPSKPVVIEALWVNKWFKAHVIEKSVDPGNPTAGIQHKLHSPTSTPARSWLAPGRPTSAAMDWCFMIRGAKETSAWNSAARPPGSNPKA